MDTPIIPQDDPDLSNPLVAYFRGFELGTKCRSAPIPHINTPWYGHKPGEKRRREQRRYAVCKCGKMITFAIYAGLFVCKSCGNEFYVNDEQARQLGGFIYGHGAARPFMFTLGVRWYGTARQGEIKPSAVPVVPGAHVTDVDWTLAA